MYDPAGRLAAALEGRYSIERELGEGGMATVYLADDLKHDRKVALKVLKPELSAVVGEERFLAEIRTTASLQHPHILPLHDSGSAEGLLYYVMPFVEGETLRERLSRVKQLPIDEAVRITTAVAGALQAAHERGIVHRDIKPANILLSRGEPLVADFGIAIAVGAGGGNRLTETGLSVGTPYYMSPEQATGDQLVGPPSDVYSLAAVLYEMLTGDPPYIGSTAQAVLGQIISGAEVSATKVRRSVPAHVDAALRRALEKLPADRFTRATDFASALVDPSFRHGEAAGAATSAGGAGPWKAATGVLTLVVLGGIGWTLSRPEPEPIVVKSVLAVETAPLSVGWAERMAVSPDGSTIIVPIDSDGVGAFGTALGFKERDAVEVTPIPGTDGARSVVFSPDGGSIVYAAGSELFRRPLVGGARRRLAQDVEPARVALDWLDDGTIIYEREAPSDLGFRHVVRIPEDGGDDIERVFPLDASGVWTPIWAHGLPGSNAFLVISCTVLNACAAERAQLYVIDTDEDTATAIADDAARAWYVPTGHIVYVRSDGTLFALPFDLGTLAVTGGATPIIEGVRIGLGTADMVVGEDGTLLYAQGDGSTRRGRELVWVAPDGAAESVDSLQTPSAFGGVQVSPDGAYLATEMSAIVGGRPNLFVKELPDGVLQQLPGTEGAGTFTWTPDGRSLTYAQPDLVGGGVDIRMIGRDGRPMLNAEPIHFGGSWPQQLHYAGPEGPLLFVQRDGMSAFGTGRTSIIDVETGDATGPIFGEGLFQDRVHTSRDGQFIAYTSGETGEAHVYVRPFPGLETVRQVSTGDGGYHAIFSPVADELFYVQLEDGSAAVWVVEYSTQDEFRVTSRTRLFDIDPYYMPGTQDWFDITPDGRRFLMSRPVRMGMETGGERLIMVQNWFAELEGLLGGR